MAKLSLRQIVLIGFAAVALSVLYYLSQSVDLESHAQTQETLKDLKHWDAALKRDVLRTRTGILKHYDTLVSTMKSIDAALDALDFGPQDLPGAAKAQLEEKLGTLRLDLEARASDLERYKLHNAILRNSLAFLPVAAGRVSQRYAGQSGTEELTADVNWVLRDALVYNLSGDAGLRQDLQKAISALTDASEAIEDEARTEIENILAHVDVILEQKPVLDRLVGNLLSPRSVSLIDAVTRHYNGAFTEIEERAELYRSILFVLAVLTVLYVAFALTQLNRAAASLESANLELEERVADRTAELSETNSQLCVHLDRIGQAMERAERSDLKIQLPEDVDGVYATLYRRFNGMIDGIRDEAEILQVAQELSGELELDALLARIMGTTTDLLDADRSTIFVHDPASGTLWSRVAEGVNIKEIRIPDDAGIAGKVFRSGTAENVTDPYAHPLFNPEVDRSTGRPVTKRKAFFACRS